MVLKGLIAVLLLASSAAHAEEPLGTAFWNHWGDGRAELSGYALTFPRYGELRRGTAVSVFVTEPFSDTLRVKADPGKHPERDVFQVLKLNLVRDFPTGIYDYNLMTSVFVALQPVKRLPAGSVAKTSFTAQEWCGHVYQQLLMRPPRMSYQLHSYFDGEADRSETYEWKSGGLTEDALFYWVRGLAQPFMKTGETRTVPLVTSLVTSRMNHVEPTWTTATLSSSSHVETIAVPAGTFETIVHRAEIDGGRTWTFYVERDEPRRIVKWVVSDGEQGELLGSARLPYWQMNGRDFEAAVEKLGLRQRSPATP